MAVLATCWWSVPLVLLSKYGVSPVPYTESAATTTSVTSLSDVLRGTSSWVGYLTVGGSPWWPLAFRIATGALPILLTGVVAGFGLAGLIRRGTPRLPERRFLLWCVLAGIVIIATGYVSSLGNPLAGRLDTVINGQASPFRNLWKFDPMVRLPVALGLAHLLAWVRRDGWYRAVFATAGVAIAGLAAPAYLSGLAAPGSFSQVPSYWVSAAGWLNAHAGHQGVLVEPGAPFGQYLWGTPLDDVLSPLTSADYAERDLSDIGSPGAERLLGTIDQRLSAGDGSAGLTKLLARMGVKYVVVRNDLNRGVLAGAWPARIHQALADSTGMVRVATFGTYVGTFSPDDAATNFDSPYPPVEIYRVPAAQPVATVQPAASTLRVYGAPESLLTLANKNLLGNRPVLLDNDGDGLPASASVLTDSLRRQLRNFGELRTSYSPTLTATQPAQTFEATDNYTEPGWDAYQSVARYAGIADVTASSSASDVGAIPAEWSSGAQPFAAVDGNLRTRWESGSWTGAVGQWIQLDFDSPVNSGTVYVAFDDSSSLGPPVAQVSISTAAGQVIDPVAATSGYQALAVPSGTTRWLRITVTGVTSQPSQPVGTQVGISEISVPLLAAARTIQAPSVPGGDPATVVLAKTEPPPSGCMLTSLRWVCSPDLATSTEEQYGFDHSFREPAAEPAALRGSAVLTDPALADKYVRLSPNEARVTGSSAYTPDPQDQALSAFDGNPATTWTASTTDTHPTLSIQWGHQRTIAALRIQRPPGASALLQVLITGSGGQLRGAMAGANGRVSFAPMRTTGLKFTFSPIQAPLQITDVTIPGVPFVQAPSGQLRLACGLGPLIELNGTVVPTRVSGSFADLLTGRPLQFTACSAVTLAAGGNRVVEPASDAFSVQDVVLNGLGAAGLPTATAAVAPAPAAAGVVSWTSTSRVLRVDAATASYLVVNENFNAGWRAVIDGRPLRAVRLDGWKQAWLLPAGSHGLVHLTYAPERPFRVAVFGGLAALAVILLLAVWPARFARRRRTPGRDEELTGQPAGKTRTTTLTSRLRRLGARLSSAVVFCVLAAVGFWLGGYPGAVIVPAATCLFLFSTSELFAPAGERAVLGRMWSGFAGPWVMAGLVIVASVCGALAGHFAADGNTSLVLSALQNAIPQTICLVVVGRLAAALILA